MKEIFKILGNPKAAEKKKAQCRGGGTAVAVLCFENSFSLRRGAEIFAVTPFLPDLPRRELWKARRCRR